MRGDGLTCAVYQVSMFKALISRNGKPGGNDLPRLLTLLVLNKYRCARRTLLMMMMMMNKPVYIIIIIDEFVRRKTIQYTYDALSINPKHMHKA